jgi:nitrogen fixation NifU-like protein
MISPWSAGYRLRDGDEGDGCGQAGCRARPEPGWRRNQEGMAGGTEKPGGELVGKNQDDWAAELQEQVIRDMERVYSAKVMELWNKPRNAGSLDYPDGYGQVTGPCGDTMQIWLRVRGDLVTEARFWTDGCGTSIVCGSMVTIMAKGKTLEQAAGINQQAVLDELGGLPEQDQHCALLAANTLRQAVSRIRPESVKERS